MGKKIIIIPIVFLIAVLGIRTYNKIEEYKIQKEISSKIIRFHVRANSDSEEDQKLKLKVRDEVMAYLDERLPKSGSVKDAKAVLNDNIEEIGQIALATIHKEGYNYSIRVYFEESYFPIKTYGDMVFPAGKYEAFRIDIGDSEGKNWWCVMFPPLCFVDVTSGIVPDDSKELLKENLSQEEYDLICNGNSEDLNNSDITFKFKIVELLNNTKMMLASKN